MMTEGVDLFNRWGDEEDIIIDDHEDQALQQALALSLRDNNQYQDDDMALAVELSLLDESANNSSISNKKKRAEDEAINEEAPLVVKKRRLEVDLASFQSEYFAECKERSERHIKRCHNEQTVAVSVFYDFPEFIADYATINSFVLMMTRTCTKLYNRFDTLKPDVFKHVNVDSINIASTLYIRYPLSKSHTLIRDSMETLYMAIGSQPVPVVRGISYGLSDEKDPLALANKEGEVVFPKTSRNWSLMDRGYWDSRRLKQWSLASLPPKLLSITIDVPNQQMIAYLRGTRLLENVNLIINYIVNDINAYGLGSGRDIVIHTTFALAGIQNACISTKPKKSLDVRIIDRSFLGSFSLKDKRI